MSAYQYPWPASRIDPETMALLYRARESGSQRLPITELIVRAIHLTYDHPTPQKGEESHAEDHLAA